MHGGHCAFDEGIDVPIIVRVNFFLELGHFGFGFGVVEIAAEVFVAFEFGVDGGDGFRDNFADGFCIVQDGLLREVANLRAFRDLHGTDEVGVEACENFEKGRLACTIATDDADVRAIEEGEIDVLQNCFCADLLCDVNERKLIFACHVRGSFLRGVIREKVLRLFAWIMDEGFDRVGGELAVAGVEAIELECEHHLDDGAAEAFHEARACEGCAAGCEEVVDDDGFFAFCDGVLMHVDGGLAIL